MLDWSDYERWSTKGSGQRALNATEQVQLENVAADIAGIPTAQRNSCWGRCSPPGRFAATVIRLSSEVTHGFSEHAILPSLDDIGLKLFKTSADGQQAGRKAVRFYRDAFHDLPGLPNQHVQQVLGAGTWGGDADSQHYVVQQWATGDTLEEINRHISLAHPLDGRAARSILEQLLGGLVVPLWSAGTVWWDFRDANYCWDQVAERLTMIDVDSLAAYADEILGTPVTWVKRDHGRTTAMARLRQMTFRVLLAQRSHTKSAMKRDLSTAWADLEPSLRVLGRSSEGPIRIALASFLERLDNLGCFVAERASSATIRSGIPLAGVIESRAVTKGTDKPIETILYLGAEGGSLTLKGRRGEGGRWQFCTSINEFFLYDLLGEEPPAPKKVRWVPSWTDALALLDRYSWPRLHPLTVHPEFEAAVFAAIAERGGAGDSEVDRWRATLRERAAEL